MKCPGRFLGKDIDFWQSEKCPEVPIAAALRITKNSLSDSMGSLLLERPIVVWAESWPDDVLKTILDSREASLPYWCNYQEQRTVRI